MTPPHPLSVYGQTKLEGDQAVAAGGGAYLILRTSWVYSTRRDSFVSKVLEWSRKNSVLRVVDDQVSGPTWARMLAQAAPCCWPGAGLTPMPGWPSGPGFITWQVGAGAAAWNGPRKS